MTRDDAIESLIEIADSLNHAHEDQLKEFRLRLWISSFIISCPVDDLQVIGQHFLDKLREMMEQSA